MDTKEALKKIKEVHGNKYTIEDGWEYVRAIEDITLFCPNHGEFHKSFYRLVNLKQGCPDCVHNGVHYKPQGYWNDKINCIEGASKYKNKWELQKNNIGCYQSLRRNGWLEEVAEMLYDESIHYMGYDEKRNYIYVYEFYDLKTFYVGRTNNIKRSDRQHRNGYSHSNGIKTFDNLYKFAEGNGIEIPQPKILEEKLIAKESQEKEDYWKNKYISDGWKTLNKGATGVGKGSLGATIRWTYDACREEAKKYDGKYDMKLGNQSAYKTSVKNGWIDEFFENKKEVDGYWDNFENVFEAARNSKNSKDMIKKFGGAYNSARKHKWTKLLEYGKES
jgi:hypothetical protein